MRARNSASRSVSQWGLLADVLMLVSSTEWFFAILVEREFVDVRRPPAPLEWEDFYAAGPDVAAANRDNTVATTKVAVHSSDVCSIQSASGGVWKNTGVHDVSGAAQHLSVHHSVTRILLAMVAHHDVVVFRLVAYRRVTASFTWRPLVPPMYRW